MRVVALKRWAELNVARHRELRCDGGCGLGSLAGELAGTDAETRADLAAVQLVYIPSTPGQRGLAG